MKLFEDMVYGLVTFGVVILLMFPYAFLFMLAWNYVMPGLFKLPILDYWQAFALLFVINMIMPTRLIGHRHDA